MKARQISKVIGEKVAELAKAHPEISGVRASTIRLIRQYRHLIDDAFHRDLRSRSLFFLPFGDS